MRTPDETGVRTRMSRRPGPGISLLRGPPLSDSAFRDSFCDRSFIAIRKVRNRAHAGPGHTRGSPPSDFSHNAPGTARHCPPWKDHGKTGTSHQFAGRISLPAHGFAVPEISDIEETQQPSPSGRYPGNTLILKIPVPLRKFGPGKHDRFGVLRVRISSRAQSGPPQRLRNRLHIAGSRLWTGACVPVSPDCAYENLPTPFAQKAPHSGSCSTQGRPKTCHDGTKQA